MELDRFSLAGLLALSVLLQGCGDASSHDSTEAGAQANSAETQVVHFTVEGMGCEACPPQVRKKIASLEGIEEADVDVDLESATCDVRLQPGDPDVEAILASVEGTQFTLKAN
jgi:copper chaperone CopZ